MKHRKPVPPKKSRKSFTKNAMRTHKFNLQSPHKVQMRGGIRL